MAYYQENSLSIASRNKIAQLLAELITANAVIEDYRQALATIPRFDSLALFRFLDRHQKGFITQKDLQFVIGTEHRKLLTYAFSWVDIRKVGEVSRFEFATFLLPREHLQLRQASLQNLEQSQVRGQPDTLNFQFGQFQALLRELMSKEMKLIELRHAIINAKDYSLAGARSAIANSDRQWICSQDLLTFLTNFGFEVTPRQTEALCEAMGRDEEGVLGLQQLKWILEGLEGKEKHYLQKIKASNKRKPVKKPTIEEDKFKQYLSSRKKSTNQKEEQFDTLMSRMKAVERQEKKQEKLLLQSQKSRIESARKTYQQQIMHLHLRREEESVKKTQQRQAQLAQHQLQLQLNQLLAKTAKLEEESDRLIRQQNRMNILEDSASIKRQIHIQLCTKEYQKIVRANAQRSIRQKLAYSPPSVRNEVRRLSIESHIKATEEYLNNARYTHKKIMRDWKQQSLILNKENQILKEKENSKRKTPGTLITKPRANPEPLAINQQLQVNLEDKSQATAKQ